MGATSDVLYPIHKQQDAAELISRGGMCVEYKYRMGLDWGQNLRYLFFLLFLVIFNIAGNKDVTLHVQEGYYGHDTFLLDVEGMGSQIKVSIIFIYPLLYI